MTEKTCSKCGNIFGCKADECGCWCENFTLSPETLAELKQEFANCLCPDCLQEYQYQDI